MEKDLEAGSQPSAAPHRARPASSISLSDCCTRCDVTFRRALFAAVMIDLGASTNINPQQCDLPDGTYADHDFQPRSVA